MLFPETNYLYINPHFSKKKNPELNYLQQLHSMNLFI